jgi:shikimate kinase
VAAVVLIGLPGSGKSSVGRALANALGLEFVDTDELIERREGEPAPQILRSRGEDEFRRLELDALNEALTTTGVVATGGGVVTTPAARERLSREHCLWLMASVSTLVSRVESGDRPLINGDARAALLRLAEERDPLYAVVADGVVEADAPLDDVVANALVVLGEWSS